MLTKDLNVLKRQLMIYQSNLAELQAMAADQTSSPPLDLSAEIEYAKGRIDYLEERQARLEIAHDPALLAAYLERVIEGNTYVDLWGVIRGRHPVQMKLEEVYFPLHAERPPEPTPADRRLLAREVEEVMARPDLAPDRKEELREQLMTRYLGRPEVRPTERLPLWEAVREHERLVILGDPGTGKSTLLRYLALRFAKAMQEGLTGLEDLGTVRLPIYVRVAEFAAARQEKPELSLDAYLSDHLSLEEKDIPNLYELCRRYLLEGRCLVLLDGLDEVIDPGNRVQIGHCIERFVETFSSSPSSLLSEEERTNLHSRSNAAHTSTEGRPIIGAKSSSGPRAEAVTASGGNRFIITSRLAGYHVAPLTDQFVHCTLRGLKADEIRAFLEHWCLAAERAKAPGLSREVVRERIDWKIEGLLWAMEVNPDLRRLASRPLMLVLLALIYRRGMRLPQRRIELYELAVKTLLRDWQLAQDIPSVALVKESEAVRLLGPLAFWLRAHRDTGLVAEEEVARILRTTLSQEHKGEGAWPVGGDVEELIVWVCQHSGFFMEHTPGHYGFVHPTFEEYFAARELVAKPNLAAERIRAHLHRPRWDEPILLAIAFIDTDYPVFASELVEQAVLAWGEKAGDLSPSPHEDILHRDLLFAARCIVEGIGLDAALRRRVVRELLHIYFDHEGQGRYPLLREQIISTFIQLRTGDAQPDLTGVLLLALKDPDWTVRVSGARALGNLERVSPGVIRGLLTALKSDQQWYVRYYAAEALGNLGPAPSETVWGLVAALKDESGGVRDAAAEALGKLGKAVQEVVWGLMAILKDDDQRVRSSVCWALSRLGCTTPGVVHILLTALGVDDWLVRDSVTRALSDLGQVRPEVVGVLLSALDKDNWRVRHHAICVLEDLGQMPSRMGEWAQVVRALLDALEDENTTVRASAAEALGSLSVATPEAIERLLAMLKSDDWRTSAAAARALGALGSLPTLRGGGAQGAASAEGAEIVQGLLAALEDRREEVRAAAARALGDLGSRTQQRRGERAHGRSEWTDEISRVLLAALQDEGRYVRYHAARALNALEQTTPQVVEGLLAALEDEYEIVRDLAVETLSRLGRTSPQVTQALLKALSSEGDNRTGLYIRHYAARALDDLGQVEPQVVQVLLVALENEDWRVRSVAARMLGSLPQADSEVVNGLLALLGDDDWRVRSAAVRALGNPRQPSLNVISELLLALKDDNWCVRSSAVQALDNLNAGLKQGPTSVIEALLEALNDERHAVSDFAARALGHLGARTGEWTDERSEEYFKEIVHSLLIALKGGDRYVRSSAARALGAFHYPAGRPSPEVIRGLSAAFRSTDKQVRFAAVEALGSFQQMTPEVVKALLGALADRDRSVRAATAGILGTLEWTTPEMVQVLLVTLKDEGRYARYQAACALGNLGVIRGERGAGRAWRLAIAEGLRRALDDPRNAEKAYLKREGCVYDFVYEALAKVVNSFSADPDLSP